ncbi:uncharacterized protein [Dysidea avara]|uniref:uncharacterized protein isoform X2 n=1 Tax=Dysidea avara TaxID=196820 RepID=UPI00331B4BCF
MDKVSLLRCFILTVLSIILNAGCSSSTNHTSDICVPVSNISINTCTTVNYGTYLNHTISLSQSPFALELIFQAVASLPNQYCRSYLQTALCVITYPPCNDTGDNITVERLCPEECNMLLNDEQSRCAGFNIDCEGSVFNSIISTFDMPLQYNESCYSILENADLPNTCTQFLETGMCSSVTHSFNSYYYNYTSSENFEQISTVISTLFAGNFSEEDQFCLNASLYFVCNYIFIPCDIYTGNPRLICPSVCDDYLSNERCNSTFETVIAAIATESDYPLQPDCNNPFQLLEEFDVNLPSSFMGNESCIELENLMMTVPDEESDEVIPAVIGGVIGGVSILAVSILVVIIIVKKKQMKNKLKIAVMEPSEVTGDDQLLIKFEDGIKSNRVITSEDIDTLKRECGDFSSLLLPKHELEFTGIIGEGEFGRVFNGMWIHKHDDGSYKSQEVAIKTVKDCESMEKLKSILHESVLMKSLQHNNILKILGVCLETDVQGGTAYIVLPYMVHGDLKTYLKNKRNSTIKRITPGFSQPVIKKLKLTEMCYQIACGMNYLAGQRIVHRDLAARNCMVDKSLTVKVADFGLARDVYISDYYRVQSNNKLPVKWMAPEALHDQISNEKTDVWSYGITCWEVFSLGRVPYPTVSNHEILDYIDAGNRPIKPKLCPDNMFALMQKCWEVDVDNRICFKDIVAELSNNDNYIRL